MKGQFYTVEELGPKQSLTPDGFLLCEDVPIARTGVQVYGPHETNVTPGDDQLVYIMREESEVFRPETIASFNGKPVLNEHPAEGVAVTPETWKRLAVGVVLNTRRGTGEFANYLLADMMIYEPSAIELVRGGKREVSCGYSAEWYETSVGHGEQRDIIGNHVALVEHARCGSGCSIGDTRSTVNDCSCAGGTMTWEDIKKKLMLAFRAKDNVAFDAALAEAKTSGKQIVIRITKDDDVEVGELPSSSPENRSKFTDEHLEGIFKKYDSMHAGHDARHTAHDVRHAGHDAKFKAHDDMFKAHHDDIGEIKEHLGMEHDDDAPGLQEGKAIEGELRAEAPPGTGDAAIKQATDSALFADSFASTVALGEVLVPGITLPVFDKAKKPKVTFLDMCAFRRRVLILANKDQQTSLLMTEARNGRSISNDGEIQAMTCGQVRDLFYAAGAMKKRSNNSSSTHSSAASAAGGPGSTGTRDRQGGPRSLAEVNKANREKWGGKQ